MSASPALHLAAPAPLLSVDRWLSQAEVLALTGWSDRWLREKSGTGEIVSRLTEKRERNGKIARAFLAASLPLPAQQKLAARLAEQSRAAMAASPLFAGISQASLQIVPAARVRAVAPETPEARMAADRLSKIDPLLQYDADPARWHGLLLKSGDRVSSKTDLVQYLSETTAVPVATLWRWLKKAKTTGLAKEVRRDKGQSRWAQRFPRAAELAVHVYLGDADQPGQSVRGALEAVEANAGTLGLRAEHLPSYETLRTLLGSLSPAMVTLAREGRRKYDETFAPYVRRGYTDVAAGEVWVSDHMIHDVYVANDCFAARDLGHMRLRFTCLFDMRSRLVVGGAWSEEGSSRSIHTALRHAATDFGLPRLFYCDNGKDYQKVARGARGSRTDELSSGPLLVQNVEELKNQGVFARLGVDVLHCIKFHPQSKHIERFFGTLHARFDKLYKTYCGAAAHLRPDAAIAALERHGKLLAAGRAADSDLPLASDFIRECLHWLRTEYIHTPQTGAGMDGRSPWEVWERERWTGARPAPAPDQLALLLADRCVRRVRECAVEIAGVRYVPADSFSSAQMLHRTTTDVVVAYDAADPDRAVALDEDGHILAHLQREELLGMYHGSADAALAAGTKDAIAASMAERHRLTRGLRDGRAALARSVRRNGYAPKVELLRGAARLSAPVAEVLTHRPVAASKLPTPPSPSKPTYAHDFATAFLSGEGE